MYGVSVPALKTFRNSRIHFNSPNLISMTGQNSSDEELEDAF